MHLLELGPNHSFRLTTKILGIPPYAILSHTWGDDEDEPTFNDLDSGVGREKSGYRKLLFCEEQGRRDGLNYLWIDTCCINKANYTELSEAINSMFRYYRDATKCYVYLSDVSHRCSLREINNNKKDLCTCVEWQADFVKSRWFTRGWTLQELIAPASVEFYSREGCFLGSRDTLVQLIHEITKIPIIALQNEPLSNFTVDERLRWAEARYTKRIEDKAYSLFGLFGIFLSPIYGEKEYALVRLREEIDKRRRKYSVSH